jgi:type VI protein secretion system component Hcp
MPGFARFVVIAAVALGLARPAGASVEIGMTVEGPRGPFASADFGGPGSVKVTNVQLDLGPASRGPLVAPRPVVVTRPIDVLSWQFLGATAASDALRVVITITRARSDSEVRHRRVVTLTNARVASIHAGMDAVPDGDRPGLGVETIAFTYERIDVEDDGLKVYSSGT